MSLGVENKLIERQNIVVRENQEQIFESFGKEEALLHVVLRRVRVVHVLEFEKI
jgi:hypothetical protein